MTDRGLPRPQRSRRTHDRYGERHPQQPDDYEFHETKLTLCRTPRRQSRRTAAVGIASQPPETPLDLPADQPKVSPPFAKGRLRCGEPPRATMAFATAGAIGGVPGSPTPVGLSVDGTMCTSTAGIWLMRSTG